MSTNPHLFVDPTTINNLLTERYAPASADPTNPPTVRVHEKMWDYEPTGARLFVVVDPTPSQVGGIIVATDYNEQVGVGIVCAVGCEVGLGPVQYPGSAMHDNPADLLYAEVIFGAHVGKPLRLDFVQDRHYSASILVMTSRDIWAVNWGGS